MSNKRYLKENSTLRLRNDGDPDHPFLRDFTILKRMKGGSGASCVCYEAMHQNSEAGVLKEFYPDSPVYLRKTDGQLVKNGKFPALEQKIRQAEEDFLKPYQILLQAKQENSEVSAFIPYFEIYRGIDEQETPAGSCYVFSVEPKVETFASICKRIHKKPGKQPEHELRQVLEGILSLTEAISTLHCMDIFHRDIKPANFGFLKQGSHLLTQKPTLFDVDTICRGDDMGELKGTPEYTDPEALQYGFSNQSDLYSIGCCLFEAVCGSEKTAANGYLYQTEYFDRLEELVNASDLLKASSANYHPRIRSSLLRILKRTLGPRGLRYEGGELLVKELREILRFILPAESAASMNGSKWVLSDLESLNRKTDWDVYQSIQRHLYRHPLYESLGADEREIRILCLGTGEYAHHFLDAALQAGQMRNMYLEVRAAAEDRAGFEEYLLNRPGLTEFFSIEKKSESERKASDEWNAENRQMMESAESGSGTQTRSEEKDSYGSLDFSEIPMDRQDQAKTIRAVLEFLDSQEPKRLPNYIFISLADPVLNEAVAKSIHRAYHSVGANGTIGFMAEENAEINRKNGPVPIPPGKGFQNLDLYPEMERLAFNTHFVWEKGMNVSFPEMKKRFRENYNHSSSAASVLHLKYKLYSVGIDLDRMDLKEAARLFHEMELDQPGDPENTVKNELLWVEHRRWVTEKLVDGYTLRTARECLNGKTNDRALRNHNCLLKSRPDQRLASLSESNPEIWDQLSDEEYNSLDSLDQMSVRLHQYYQEQAEKQLARRLADNAYLKAIEKYLEDRNARNAYCEWRRAIQGVRNNEASQIRLYPSIRSHFLRSLSVLSDLQKKQVENLVSGFDAQFYPVLASKEKKNWKSNDTAFIENIPFILTYCEDSELAIPFCTGSQSEIFQNTAAAFTANPASILYLCYIREVGDLKEIRKALPGILDFMNRKNIRSTLRFQFLVREEVADSVSRSDLEEIRNLDSRIRKVSREVIRTGETTAFDRLHSTMAQALVKRGFFSLERNDSPLSEFLDGRGFYESFPGYSLDLKTGRFKETGGPSMLEFINKKPFITVEDMAAFRSSRGVKVTSPELISNYCDLWSLYGRKRKQWKALSEELDLYDRGTRQIANFRNSRPTEATYPASLRYVMPGFTMASIQKILERLIRTGVVGADSEIRPLNVSSIEILISDRYQNTRNFDILFSDPYRLMLPDAISLEGDHDVRVWFDSLIVNRMNPQKSMFDDDLDLLESFQKRGLINGLNFSRSYNSISFTYSSEESKHLLTSSGRILEIYVYQKALETGSFDSVAASTEIEWKEEGISNEFDLIATKGFRSLFVECKSTQILSHDYYYKLAALADYFGINATVVLVGDTREGGKPFQTAPNERQRRRGKALEVITVSDSYDIHNIGSTLSKILDGTWQPHSEKTAAKQSVNNQRSESGNPVTGSVLKNGSKTVLSENQNEPETDKEEKTAGKRFKPKTISGFKMKGGKCVPTNSNKHRKH